MHGIAVIRVTSIFRIAVDDEAPAGARCGRAAVGGGGGTRAPRAESVGASFDSCLALPRRSRCGETV